MTLNHGRAPIESKVKPWLSRVGGELNELEVIARYTAIRAEQSGRLSPAMDAEDCYQEAFVFFLEKPGRLKAYYEKALPFQYLKISDRNRVSPASGTRCNARKKGKEILCGEVSLEVLATTADGDGDWQEWLELNRDCATNEEDDGYEVSFFNIALSEASSLLQDIRRQQKLQNDAGISFAKTRNRYHLECIIAGKKQFIGQYLTKTDALEAKQKFLGDFMDAVLDAIDDV